MDNDPLDTKNQKQLSRRPGKRDVISRFEMTIEQKHLHILEDIQQFKAKVWEFTGKFLAEYKHFNQECDQLQRTMVDMEWTWKKWMANQLQEQFDNSELLKGLGIFKESPRLRDYEKYNEEFDDR